MKRKSTAATNSKIIINDQGHPNDVNLFSRLIKKEIEKITTLIDIDAEELEAWVNLQIGSHLRVPEKSILQLLRTARQYQLDPLQEEVAIYKFDESWQVSISADGWIKIMNSQSSFVGISFNESSATDEGIPEWIECSIYRSDRVIPTVIREYFTEVKKEGEIWVKMPRRMLRHRALQQCARVAFGISFTNFREGEIALNEQKLGLGGTLAEDKINNRHEITQISKLKSILSG